MIPFWLGVVSTEVALQIDAIGDDAPCTGLAAVHALYGMGFDDDEVKVARPKLEGRPAGRVRALLANLEGQRRELWIHHISEFAKVVPSLRRVA